MAFSNIIPNWTNFVKEVFWSEALFRKWRNDCIVTKRKLNFPFLSSFNPWVWNHHLDISLAISGYIWSSQAKTSSVIAIWNFFGLTDRHERVLEELSLLKIACLQGYQHMHWNYLNLQTFFNPENWLTDEIHLFFHVCSCDWIVFLPPAVVRRADVTGSGMKTGWARLERMRLEKRAENRPRTCMVIGREELSCLRNRSRLVRGEGGGVFYTNQSAIIR